MRALQNGRAELVRSAYIEGTSYQELSNTHGVPINTIRTWLRRSLLDLRTCLDCKRSSGHEQVAVSGIPMTRDDSRKCLH